MGAIAALLSFRSPPDGAVVIRMLAAAPHRGSRHLTASVGKAVVGVCGGDVLSEDSLACDSGLAVAFVGSLDNIVDLHKDLCDNGCPPAGGEAADVVLAGIRHWGPLAVSSRLRGVFAILATDGITLWCIRDHFGAKPLFYQQTGEHLVAATEAKQVAATQRGGPQPNPQALEAYFYGRLNDDLPSMLEGVLRVPRTTVLTARAGHVTRVERYWNPEPLLERSRLSLDDALDAFLPLLDRAVGRCLTGNDSVSLSGGIDSTTIAAAAAPQHLVLGGSPLGAISSVYPDLPSVDERHYIELVGDALGLDLHLHVPRARPLDDLDKWVRLLDGPISAVSIPELAEHYAIVRSHGYRTILMGEVAEALFDDNFHIFGHLFLRGRWRALGRMMTAQHSAGRSWRRLARMLAVAVVPSRPAMRYATWRRINWRVLPDWIDPAEMGGIAYRSDLATPAWRRWADGQYCYLKGPLVSWEADEIVASAHDVSVRVPFADVDLWEFFISLRAETKFPDGLSKSFVRKAMRGRVPDAILDRKDKTLFDAWAHSTADFATLRRWLVNPPHRLKGVDYSTLGDRVERQQLAGRELMWANDLAGVHAFLGQW